jgi:hypothetical protein
MEKVILFISLQLFCLTGFCQNPRWTEFGTRIPALPDLEVRWNTPTNSGVGSNLPTNSWPASMGIYRLTPRHFSPEIISNLMVKCSLVTTNKVKQSEDTLVFKNGARVLTITYSSGSIKYDSPERNFGPTNLAQGVPQIRDMPRLITNFLSGVGIMVPEIAKDTNGAPAFNLWQPYTWFFVDGKTITNIEAQAAVISRAVEGAKVIGQAGICRLQFGEGGLVSKIELSWPALELSKTFPTLKPDAVMQAFHQGKVVQGFLPTDFSDIDWRKVKSVTIKQAWPSYFAGTTKWLYPFLTLWATVETDHGSVDIELDCPIIDESH